METTARRVGIVGLGQMGGGMLKRLRASGVEALGYDALPGRSESSSLSELCRFADVVVLSLPDAAAVKQAVLAEDGLAHDAKAGQVLIDTSTTDPELVRQIEGVLSARSVDFVDAPVSGGRIGAESGTLTMLIGGDRDVVERLTPILDVLTAKRFHLGPVGSAQTAKLLNNLLVATQLVAVGEAVRAAVASGLDQNDFIASLNESSGRSAVSEINFPRWIANGAFDSGFSMKLMRKDLRAAMEHLSRLGLELPLSEAVGSIWADSASRLADDDDFNRITEVP